MRLFPPHFLLRHILIITFLLFVSFLSVRAQIPTITSFTATSVCQGNTITITITGTNFTGATAVKAGSLNVSSFTVNSATSITAVVSDQAGNGAVTITTPVGTATSAGALTVLPSPKPALKDETKVNAQFTNCDGNSMYQLNVSNTSSTTGAGNAYEINWGDNTAPFTQTDWPADGQTSHVYNTQGYFTITITIKPVNGCTRSRTYQFYNGKNPIASFTTSLSTTGLCAPASIEFQIGNWTTNSAGTTYDIDFGDGSPHVVLNHPLSADIHKLTHQYIKSSCPDIDFTATLKAINGCFTTTYTLNQIIIRKKPVVDFSITPSPACLDAPVCFTNQTISGSSGNNFCDASSDFLWNFGDGTTSHLENPPCHQYATAGTYNVTLTASNISCGSDMKMKQVVVTAASPPPTVSATPVAYCEGETAVPLTATGTGLLWYLPNGTVVTAAPTPGTNIRGTTTYYVTQTLTGRCESPKVPVNVIINGIPDAPATGNVTYCQGQTAVPLIAGGSNLLWYPQAVSNAGVSSVAPTPSTATVGATVYFVSQTINGCESPRANMLITIDALPVAPVVTSPLSYCQHQTAVPLTATGTNLLWYTTAVGGIGSSTAPIPSTAITGSKTYYVSQVTGCGESPRVAITVNVNAGPSATITYTPAILCNTATMPVVVTHNGSTGGSYSVSPSGLTINTNTGEITPLNAIAGVYTITYTILSSGGCANYTATTTVTVNGVPTATINYPAMCTSDAPINVRLTGTSGGSFSSNTTGLSIDPSTGTITPATSTPGDYIVTYTIVASAPCAGFSITAPVKVTLAASAAISYIPASLCNIVSAPMPVIRSGTSGGSYSISPAGMSIDATTGAIDASGVTPGMYTITYTIPGAGGCTNYTTNATVTISAVPTATINYTGSPYCGAITIPQPVSLSGTAGGTFSSGAGLSINTTTGAINPSLSTPGAYVVTYTIAASPPCPGYTTTTNVRVDESPVVTFQTPTQSICSGETAVFVPSSTVGNTSYTWSVTLPPNIAGISSGTSSGAISLSFTNTGTIVQALRVRVIPVNPSQPPCQGAAYDIILNVKPATPAPVTDTANFCMKAAPAALSVSGTMIKWYDGNGTLLNAAPVVNTNIAGQFVYYVTQSNSYGCESPKSEIVAVVHPVAKIISSTSLNPTICGVPSGTIVLHVLDLNDGAIPGIPVSVHYNKFQIAHTFSGSTDATGKITIPLTAGTYSNISVETSGGCTSQKIPDVFVLKDPTPPEKPVAGYNPPICNATPLTLTALTATGIQAGPIDYVWAGPAFGPFADTVKNTVITFPSASVSDEGTYVVYAIQNNCISLPASFEIVINQSPAKPVISTRTPLCVGDELFLQAYSSIPGNATLNYVWNGQGAGFPVNAPNASINNVKVEDAGIYSITVSSPETGCSSTTDTMIQIGGYPKVVFAQDTVAYPTGYRFILSPVITNLADPGILPIQNYTWTPSADLSCNDAMCSSPVVTVKNHVCYNVKVTNIYGCSGGDTFCINVFCKNSQVFIPNAFAPSGNIPENKKLIVRATGISSVKSFRIFNRWGKLLFERSNFSPNSADFGWDGMVNGKVADTGVYIYTVDVICENGVPYSFKGNVTLF